MHCEPHGLKSASCQEEGMGKLRVERGAMHVKKGWENYA